MSTTERFTGQVKWVNNKTGYGFITLCNGEHKGKDIFTHYSSIRVSDSQYKYLVQGEYVELGIMRPENSQHEFQAVDVYGILGGHIMCETRQMNVSNDKRPRKNQKPKSSKDVATEVVDSEH